MDMLLVVLMAWTAVASGLPLAPVAPRIDYAPAAQLAAMRYGHEVSAADATVVALYVPSIKTIFLQPEWDSRSPADVSVIVHELVHHLQQAAGQRFPCAEAGEKAAFAAQQRWLEQFDLDLESAFGIDGLTLFLRTRCLSP